jgi:hypothetical protein
VWGVGRMGGLPLVHARRPAFVDHALAVEDDGVLGLHAHGFHQGQRGQARRAGAGQHHLDVFHPTAGDLACVDQAGGRDDGGAVLVVVEHRDVQQILQLALDDEALGGLDVLKVDAAEAGPEVLDHGDELIRVLGRDLQVEGVEVGEALEQHRLALHHRLGRQGAQVAQAKNSGPVGDHRHGVALGRIVIGAVGIGRDRQHRYGHARRVRQRQVALGRHGLGRRHRDLPRRGVAVEVQRLFVGEGLFFSGHAAVGGLEWARNLAVATACLNRPAASKLCFPKISCVSRGLSGRKEVILASSSSGGGETKWPHHLKPPTPSETHPDPLASRR